MEELPGPRVQPVGGMMLFWDEKRLPNCLHGLFLREFPHVFFLDSRNEPARYSEVFKAKRWAAGGSGGTG